MRWRCATDARAGAARRVALALALLLPAAGAAADAAGPLLPRMADETASSGVVHSYDGDWEYMVGGGAAALDCDDDGFPDLALAGGAAPAGLWRNIGVAGGPLRFARVEGAVALDAVTGIWPLDVDGDGVTDLAVLRLGEDVLLRGLGDCRFERASEAWGFDGGDEWSTAFAATWEAGEDWPTLAVGTYVDRNEEAFPWGSCTPAVLHRPRPGGGGFAPPLPLEPGHCALSMLITDWDRSGTPSLRVSNDREYYKGGQEQLWRMPPGAPPRLWTEDEGWKRLRIWGMGIASRDLDGDGFPEYYLTSMADNKLQALAAPPAPGAAAVPDYADIAFARGLTAHRPHTGGDLRPSTAWHAQFEDVNNDGRADLFVAKGNVAEMPDFAQRDPNNLLVQGEDGRFVEAAAAAGVASMGVARGGVLADFNLDGLVDLVVVNRWTAAELWRNTTAGTGGWVQLALDGPGANRDGIGAWIELRAGGRVERREITVGGGHGGGGLGWWHFGLGAAAEAEVRVLWPGGATGDWQPVAPGGFWRLAPGRPPQRWTPPRGGG
jgi:hypothetical protein